MRRCSGSDFGHGGCFRGPGAMSCIASGLRTSAPQPRTRRRPNRSLARLVLGPKPAHRASGRTWTTATDTSFQRAPETPDTGQSRPGVGQHCCSFDRGRSARPEARERSRIRPRRSDGNSGAFVWPPWFLGLATEVWSKLTNVLPKLADVGQIWPRLGPKLSPPEQVFDCSWAIHRHVWENFGARRGRRG